MTTMDARSLAEAAAAAYNPYDVAFLEREFEVYDLLRAELPIARTEAITAMGAPGSWVLTRYDQSCDFLQDHASFSNQSNVYPVRPWIPQAIDPPAHSAYRRIMNPWFTVDEMRHLEPHLEKFAEELVDTMLDQGDDFDFVAAFADPFPTVIFCQLAGFPLDDYQQIMNWKNTLMHCADGHVRGFELAAEMARELGHEVSGSHLTPEEELAVRSTVGQRIYAYLGGLIDRRRAEPTDDMITKLLAASYEGERPLTQEELEDTLFLFYMAGLDTVASALGLIVQTFAANPGKRREFIELMDDPERVGPAVEELIRYHAIVLLPRRVTQDVTFHGTEFAHGSQVLCPTMAANRDASEFAEPNELVFDRTPNRHLGFGLGPHRCIGIHLARREVRIALQVFHRKLPDYHPDPERRAEAFGGMKGLSALPLVKG